MVLSAQALPQLARNGCMLILVLAPPLIKPVNEKKSKVQFNRQNSCHYMQLLRMAVLFTATVPFIYFVSAHHYYYVKRMISD